MDLPTIGHASAIAPDQNSDIIFVCIDFENGKQIRSHASSGSMGRKKKAQAGVSIFDTSPQDALRTYNIGFGGSPSDKRLIDRRFLFGETNWIPGLAYLLDSIEALVDRTRKSSSWVTDSPQTYLYYSLLDLT